MAEYFAHSGKGDYPPQSYADHIQGVQKRAVSFVNEIFPFSVMGKELLEGTVFDASLFHDLGKLDDQNQRKLSSPGHTRESLPVNHVDAGSAALQTMGNMNSALLIYSHHRGLPDILTECHRGKSIFRDEHPRVRKEIDQQLPKLLKLHNELVNTKPVISSVCYSGDSSVFFRMALSCLADADHSDTAAVYGKLPERKTLPSLRPLERLSALNRYVSNLEDGTERSLLRKEMYTACRDASIDYGISACDSPVGSGKTTAVMAHLLQQAEKRGSRRVFVVLPYTNIIEQSVDIYRKALVLPDEDPEEVVAELHYRADFQDKETRYLTALWRAPIIVTTAVAFFETLASNKPSALRRFHELPGSVIFIDEAHNALPIKLLPLAWRWINILSREWSCYWVLASGSLVRYWELNSFLSINMERPIVPELVMNDLRCRLMKYEYNRVSFRWRSKSLDRNTLIHWINGFPGPRLLIVNTVQTAAVIARDICTNYGRESVEHLSTALTPEDRERIISSVKTRLKDSKDADWTLVATSCVEAGVDFSFRTGFRELSSTLSLLQSAGRVNRNGVISDAEMWSFTLQDDSLLKDNPGLEDSQRVLRRYFEKGEVIIPEISTRSMDDEITQDDSCLEDIQKLLVSEETRQFQEVADHFKVIDSNTICAIVDEELCVSISKGKGNWKELQRKSVSIRRSNLHSWCLKEITSNVYQWTLSYDGFLGYMAGVLQLNDLNNGTLFL